MARSVGSLTGLPEPGHVFARWIGGAAVGLWALGAQSLPDPLNKIVAFLSPGIGYLIGHATDAFIRRLNIRAEEKTRQHTLRMLESTIANLTKIRADSMRNGEDANIVTLIDTRLAEARKRRVELIAMSASGK